VGRQPELTPLQCEPLEYITDDADPTRIMPEEIPESGSDRIAGGARSPRDGPAIEW
jgi:hypothetical protein